MIPHGCILIPSIELMHGKPSILAMNVPHQRVCLLGVAVMSHA
jgi:hypothetical protein